MALFLGTQEITPTLTSNGASSPVDDWGQSLQGNIVTDSTFLCAPYKCYYNDSITSFTATNATVVGSLASTFYFCTHLTNVSLPSLETVKVNGMDSCFYGCSGLTSVTFPALETIEENGFAWCFCRCSGLTSVTFTSLTSLGDYAFGSASMTSYSCFNGCTNLASVSFPALTTQSFGEYTHQFSALFDTNTASASGECVVHFPSNLESTISGLYGYPYFIARNGSNTRITLAFDLPATS